MPQILHTNCKTLAGIMLQIILTGAESGFWLPSFCVHKPVIYSSKLENYSMLCSVSSREKKK